MGKKLSWMAGCVLLCALWVGGACLDPNNIYVDAGAPGPGNGSLFKPFPDIGSGVSAVAEGGIVHVAAGEYHETVVIGKPSTLLGAGSDLTQLISDMESNGIEIQASDVTVSGFSIAGEGSPNPGEMPVAGLFGQNVNNITIRDNEIGPYSGWGIAVGQASGILIENNLVQQITDQPAFLYDATGILVHMASGSIRDNTSAHNVHGMLISGERGSEFNLSVTGNRMEQNDYWGLVLNEAYRIMDFSDNAILNNAGPGVVILDEVRYWGCQIAGGGNCEAPTTEIDNCSNNTQSGNNPDTGGGCLGGGGDLNDPCENDLDCLDPLVCDSGYSNICKRPLGGTCFGDSECVHPYACCYYEPPGECVDAAGPCVNTIGSD